MSHISLILISDERICYYRFMNLWLEAFVSSYVNDIKFALKLFIHIFENLNIHLYAIIYYVDGSLILILLMSC